MRNARIHGRAGKTNGARSPILISIVGNYCCMVHVACLTLRKYHFDMAI